MSLTLISRPTSVVALTPTLTVTLDPDEQLGRAIYESDGQNVNWTIDGTTYVLHDWKLQRIHGIDRLETRWVTRADLERHCRIPSEMLRRMPVHRAANVLIRRLAWMARTRLGALR
jgi:hypothetical protein